MPVFVEWKWVEKTGTFLAIFHFWDDGEKENLRMRVKETGFETLAWADYENISKKEFTSVMTVPFCGLTYPRTNAYLSWAPSHAEFCLLTEVLTYANLINGFKPPNRRKLRSKLQGIKTIGIQDGKELVNYEVDSELLAAMPRNSIVSFAGQECFSFEIRLEYVEYLRKLVRPFIV